MRTLACDIETYRNYFLVCFEDLATGERLYFEVRGAGALDYARLERVMLGNRIITYNGLSFDVPIIFAMIRRAQENFGQVEAQWGHKYAERTIGGGLKYWEVEQALDIVIPRRIEHVDLIEPQPNAWASLKILNGRLHGRWMQDLPYPPDRDLTDAQMDEVLAYCWNDLAATKLLFEAVNEPLALRAALSDEYGEDLRSKSDSQIGERIIRKRVQEKLGRKIERVETKPGTTFRYDVPDFIQFETPELAAIVDRLRETDFVVRADGKVDLPKWLKDAQVVIGETTYAMGIGGLHSTESNRSAESDEEVQLLDADVGAYYPAIILNSGLYPVATGPDFLDVYKTIRVERMRAKRRVKEINKELEDLREELAEMEQPNG